jgi:hypothetical protein
MSLSSFQLLCFHSNLRFCSVRDYQAAAPTHRSLVFCRHRVGTDSENLWTSSQAQIAHFKKKLCVFVHLDSMLGEDFRDLGIARNRRCPPIEHPTLILWD